MPSTLKLPVEIVKLSGELQEDGYPFEAVILSGEPIDSWYGGHFIVDLSTMKYHKPRLTVNYNHNNELVIGYGENFQVTPEGLKSTGKLAAFADELVNLARQGVPFEASVEIDLNNAVETRIGANASIAVNGRTYAGPISVYNDVPLRGYAICPLGADKLTHFTLLQRKQNYMAKPPLKKMSQEDDAPNPETAVQSAVKSQELADLCTIFGDSNGIKLFQEGVDVNEVRQWQSLNDKYAKYLPSVTLNDDKDKDEPADPPAEDEPPKEDEPKDKEDEKLSATVLSKLSALDKKLESQSAEIVKLKAAIPPNGAEPVSHNTETPKGGTAQPKNSVQKYAAKYKSVS